MDSNYSLSDIAAVSGGNRNNGLGGGDLGALLVLFILLSMMGRGGLGNLFGGFGGGDSCGSPCATQADVRAAVDQQTLISKLDQQTYGLADTFTALNNTINSNFRGVDNALCTLGYQTQTGFNSLAAQLAKCCCDIERGIDGVNYNMAKNTCDLQNTMNSNTRDLLDNQNSNTRAILDFLTKDKIETLQAENQALKFQASQARQNDFIAANQEAQTATLLRRLGADCPVPAYVVQAPTPISFPVNSCGQVTFGNNGCGCGNGYGYGYNGVA